MSALSAFDLSARLVDLLGRERRILVEFVVQLAEFDRHRLYVELGYTSLFYYLTRHLRLSEASAYRRGVAAGLVGRFPEIADMLRDGRLSLRSLAKLREVLNDENQKEVLARAAGRSEAEAEALAVEYKPRPIPRDLMRAVPVAAAARPEVPAAAPQPWRPQPEAVKPLTRELHRLQVTVSGEFVAELAQVRAALSHKIPDGDFEGVVREGFRLVLAEQRKRKALTERPRTRSGAPRPPGDRYIPAEVKRAVWTRDGGQCAWPMPDGSVCGKTHRVQFDHRREVALGGTSTIDNVWLLCQGHNLLKAEMHLGRELMDQCRSRAPRAFSRKVGSGAGAPERATTVLAAPT